MRRSLASSVSLPLHEAIVCPKRISRCNQLCVFVFNETEIRRPRHGAVPRQIFDSVCQSGNAKSMPFLTPPIQRSWTHCFQLPHLWFGGAVRGIVGVCLFVLAESLSSLQTLEFALLQIQRSANGTVDETNLALGLRRAWHRRTCMPAFAP